MLKQPARQSNRWKMAWRETVILLREFRRPVLTFAVAIIGLGLIYHSMARQAGEPLGSVPEAIYLMLTLAFLQPSGNFPHNSILQIFYFLMPVIGVFTLAQGLAEFGVMLFNRRARNKEWEMAVASTYNNHTVLVGLGHLGFRVVEELHAMREDVVVIELNPNAEMVPTVRDLRIPVITDDATRKGTLEAAGIPRAETIILATQNDSLNLQIALNARSLNKDIKVVIRIFDADFAQSLHAQFGFIALSANGMAAPVFAAAAVGADVTNPISIEGKPLSLARLLISPSSLLKGKSVGFLEDSYHLNVVLVRHDNKSEMHPTRATLLSAGDTLAVLSSPEPLDNLLHDND